MTMTSEIEGNPLQRLFRACEPNESLGPDDPRYVNCDDVRGENVPRLYERSLRLADPTRPEVKVFAGHRGVGKSSELLRLKGMLERPSRPGERPFQVIYFDVSKSQDLNDLDFPDLLVFTAAEVQRQLQEAKISGFSATNTLLEGWSDEIRQALGSHVSLPGGHAGLGFASLSVEIKNRPSSRSLLREEIEKRSTSLLAAVNDLLTTASVTLRADKKKKREGLVLIVDGLDKLVRRELPGGVNTHERLFLHRSEQLASLKAHVVYTVPISLLYSPQFTQLAQTFGEYQQPVPMICLRGEDRAEPSPATPGMTKLKEMIEARLRYAGIEFAEAFDRPETCEHLCRMTGGHPRHLMMFLQAATGRLDALPISRKAVDKAIASYANSLMREVPDTFWTELRRFVTPQDELPKDAEHQEMLLLLYLFEYMNGQPWYEVNPVLASLPRFQER
jgi:hypothetical protein